MSLESCMILLDNSEYMRNGDYVPTRLEAQQDAANLLVGTKTQSHPESTVGVSAGTELLVSPTSDVGKILNALHGLPIKSNIIDVTASVQVASLALKHRRNKNGAQRIVLFVGSPMTNVEVRALAKAGRQLKKNNVSIDVVAMGELEENEAKLKELVDAANGRSEEGVERTCHLVTIPAGVLPSDVLASSPIVHGGTGGSAFAASAAAAAATGGGDMGGGFADFGGVDPNMDPELAMALRVSMEEERARQERMAAQSAAQPEETKDAEMTDAPAAGSANAAASAAMDMGLSEEEALLQQALAMSMNENEPAAASESKEESKPAAAPMEEDDEAAAMQMALQMSMQAEQDNKEEAKSGEGEGQQQFQDPQFVNQLLGSLPGVNQSDPAIQSALQNLNQGDKKDGDDKEDGDKKE
jgi:26S proteasome regulatory subunit N10